VESIRNAWGYNVLEAIMWIDENKDEFSSEVRKELREFFRQGRQLFGV